MRGGGGIRRSHLVAMAHLKAELWLARWHQNKHGGHNESNKAFGNKCYLLYEINKFRINNSRVWKVINGWLSAWPSGSHRLVSWIRINTKHNTITVGNFYGPQENEQRQKVKTIYRNLRTQIIQAKQEGPVILTGDFNAKLHITKQGNTIQNESNNGKIMQN